MVEIDDQIGRSVLAIGKIDDRNINAKGSVLVPASGVVWIDGNPGVYVEITTDAPEVPTVQIVENSLRLQIRPQTSNSERVDLLSSPTPRNGKADLVFVLRKVSDDVQLLVYTFTTTL